MEAMWTRFQPAIVRMRELIADGAIGEVRSVQVDLGVRNPLDPADRFFDPAIGGGALFDLTVYPISFAQMVLGNPTGRPRHGTLRRDGVDLEESVLLGFAGGRDGRADRLAALRDARPGAGVRHRTAGSTCCRASTTRTRSSAPAGRDPRRSRCRASAAATPTS